MNMKMSDGLCRKRAVRLDEIALSYRTDKLDGSHERKACHIRIFVGRFNVQKGNDE